jgi:hypothetical protein
MALWLAFSLLILFSGCIFAYVYQLQQPALQGAGHGFRPYGIHEKIAAELLASRNKKTPRDALTLA